MNQKKMSSRGVHSTIWKQIKDTQLESLEIWFRPSLPQGLSNQDIVNVFDDWHVCHKIYELLKLVYIYILATK